MNYVEGDKWEKVVERNSDKLEKKPGYPNIYKKGTDYFVVYDPDGPGGKTWESAATGETINSTTYYWWGQ